MASSRLVDAEGSHEDLPNMSHAYTRVNEEIVEFERSHLRRLSLIAAAGGVLSTASDMAKYVQFHMNGGQVDGVQIIPEVMKTLKLPIVATPTLCIYNFKLIAYLIIGFVRMF